MPASPRHSGRVARRFIQGLAQLVKRIVHHGGNRNAGRHRALGAAALHVHPELQAAQLAAIGFGRALDQMILRQPLTLVGAEASYNISVHVQGGGEGGQASAVRLGIARALVAGDANLRPALKAAGFLTRDARAKERKKPGLKRARKAPQYTKR